MSRVRVHTDAAAHEAARSILARAFTVDGHIAFSRDAYVPSSETGQRLLAHELTHVLQQARGSGPTLRGVYRGPERRVELSSLLGGVRCCASCIAVRRCASPRD
ncbi:MAG TPA: DUF4157 domain-containing protein [Polyangiaceae bacterium]